MKLREIVSILDTIAPPEMAEESDKGRIGLILDRCNEINLIATSLDVTEQVLREAARQGADMLVSHHTPIYEPVNRLLKRLGDVLKIAFDSEISIFVMHTNYDRAPGGVNDVLASLLGLTDVKTAGIGRIGTIPPVDTAALARFAADKLDTHTRYIGDHEISKVMVMGGSGFKSEFIEIALEAGADAMISGELRHEVLEYARDISLIDATHYATENPAMQKLTERLPVESVFIDRGDGIRVVAR